MRKWSDLQLAHADDLALILTTEQASRCPNQGGIAIGAAYTEWFGEEAKRAYGDVIRPSARPRLIAIKQPGGVCAAITPVEFPSSMITQQGLSCACRGLHRRDQPAAATRSRRWPSRTCGPRGFPPGGPQRRDRRRARSATR